MRYRNRRETMEEWTARLDAQAERLEVAPHVVYRAYDEFGTLLYIGCTVNLEGRLASHRGSSPWRRYMARCEVEGFVGIKAARAAESAAIKAEWTPFNCTPADIARTQMNRNEARRRLSEIGIYPPQFEITDETIDTFAETQEWADHCAEGDAYHQLVDEVRAELKETDYPYLTTEDRLEQYLAMRAQTSERAA